MDHDCGADEYLSVLEVLALYFDGLHCSDIARLQRAFHARAHYVCATDAKLTYLTMAEYMPLVAARPSPQSRGEPRRDRVLSVEFAGPMTALVRLECSIGQKLFTDLLSLVKVEGRWQIISKVFHYERIGGIS